MADVHDKQTRSFNMSQIKGVDTKPEMLVRKFLFANGLRYRLHDKKLPGKPDIVLPKFKTVIFVNGCFWLTKQSPSFKNLHLSLCYNQCCCRSYVSRWLLFWLSILTCCPLSVAGNKVRLASCHGEKWLIVLIGC